MKKFYVYSLKASDENNIFYIGKTFEGSNRLNEHKSHCKSYKHRTARKIKSILDRGSDIIMEKIECFDNEIDCHTKEIELIKIYGIKDDGGILTNNTHGGEGCVGYKHSLETRQKMSLSKMNNKINVGRKRPDVKEKWSKKVSSYDMNGDYLRTFNSAREAAEYYGISFAQISDCCIGKIKTTRLPNNTGFIRFKFGECKSNIGKIKQNQRSKGNIVQYDIDGNELARFYNAREAYDITNISDVCIRNCCNGKQKTAGGFLWKIIKD